MYNEGNNTANTNQPKVIVLQPNQVQLQTNANTAPAATSNSGYPGAQQHASSLNSGYPGTASRAQQLNDGRHDPNTTRGCTNNMRNTAILSIILIIVGFILAFLIDTDDSDCDTSSNNNGGGGMGGGNTSNDCDNNDTSAFFTIGLLLLIIGCIMVMCLLCNAFGCVPCFICCLGPPIWGPPLGAGGMWWGARGPRHGPHGFGGPGPHMHGPHGGGGFHGGGPHGGGGGFGGGGHGGGPGGP